MSDIISSFREWFNEKFNSPLYFTYIGIFVLYHWKSVYVLFFENVINDSNRITTALNYWGPHLDFTLRYKSFEISFLDEILNFILPYLVPVVLTYVFIEFIPILNSWAHRIYLKNLLARKIQFYEHLSEVETKRARLLKESVKARQSQVESVSELEKQKDELIEQIADLQGQLGNPSDKKQDRNNDLNSRWEDELNEIIDNDDFIVAMRKGEKAIYYTQGRITNDVQEKNPSYYTYVSPGSLSLLDTMGIISIPTKDKDVIEFTDKGKFFVRKIRIKGLL